MTFTGLTNCWLEVTIGTGFGLAASETHWWGNAVGDTGAGNTTKVLVNTDDEIMCRPPYLHNPFNRAPVSDQSDLDKNSLVNTDDEILCRPPYTTNPFTAVSVITR